MIHPDAELCLAEIFKNAGYDTAYIGKWHLDGHGRKIYIPPARRQGFGYWKAEECDRATPVNDSPERAGCQVGSPLAANSRRPTGS